MTCCCCNIPGPLAGRPATSTVLVSTTLHPSHTRSLSSSCRVAAMVEVQSHRAELFAWQYILLDQSLGLPSAPFPLYAQLNSNPIQNSKHNTSASYFSKLKTVECVAHHCWPKRPRSISQRGIRPRRRGARSCLELSTATPH